MCKIVDLCLICLTNNDDKNLKSILSKDSDGVLIEQKLKYFLLEIVSIKPETSIHICLPCLKKLDHVYKFKQLCLQNIAKLNSYFTEEQCRKSQIIIIDANSLKEKLVQCENDYNREVTRSENFCLDNVTVKSEPSEDYNETENVLQSEHTQNTETDDEVIRKQNNIGKEGSNVVKEQDVVQFEFVEVAVKEEPKEINDNTNKSELIDNLKYKLQKKLTQDTEIEDVSGKHNNIEQNINDEPEENDDDSNMQLESDTCQTTNNTGSPWSPGTRSSSKKSFKCMECPKTFKQRNDFITHMRIHTRKKPFKCDLCDRSYSHASALRNHKVKHSGEKRYECEVCGKKFYFNTHLEGHKRVHTGERPYKCGVCNKAFSHSSTLVNHKRLHTGERPYGCEVCGQLFTYLRTLERHRPIHTGETPYKCDVCDREFNQRCSLKRHLKIHAEKPT